MSKASSRLRKGPSRDQSKEHFWRKTLREHAASGRDVRAFCQERGLSEPSFYGWRRTLAQREGNLARRGARLPRPRFVELCPPRAARAIAAPADTTRVLVPTAPASGVAEAPLELVAGGLRLVIRPGCDRSLLRDVLQAMASLNFGPEA